jgi:HrpA-like RNA helicase
MDDGRLSATHAAALGVRTDDPFDLVEQQELAEAGSAASRRLTLIFLATSPPFLRREAALLGIDPNALASAATSSIVPCVRDPNGDLIRTARLGSELVHASRQERARAAAADKLTSKSSIVSHLTSPAAGSARPRSRRTDAPLSGLPTAANEPLPLASSTLSAAFKAGLGSDAVPTADSLAVTRRALPAYEQRQSFLDLVSVHPVIVVVGATGSGKSTQLPQYLLEAGWASGEASIVVTQPRRVAAVTVAQRVAQERGCELGGEVGFAIRFEDVSSSSTRLRFATDGVLLRQAIRDPLFLNYSVVVIDEAHERSLDTDVLLGLLQTAVRARRDLRVVVTSATLASDKFSQFFSVGGIPAPVLEIPGRTHPVQIDHLRVSPADYVAKAVETTMRVHQLRSEGDILVFLPGEEEITVALRELEKRGQLAYDAAVRAAAATASATAAGSGSPPTSLQLPSPVPEIPRLLPLPLFSQLRGSQQALVFRPAPPGFRKVIVATNIAETSLTVDGVVFVVDCGFSKQRAYHPKLGLDVLAVTPISRAGADQRAGRAGRTRPGHCYRLYPAAAYRQEMLDEPVPEIMRSNLAAVLLLLKTIGVDSAAQFPFIDPPSPLMFLAAARSLWLLGALDGGGALTRLGRDMSRLPLDPPLAAVLLAASERLGCAAEALSVVAMLCVPPVLLRPPGQEEAADAAHARLQVAEGDHLTLLNIYSQWTRSGRSPRWAESHFLHQSHLQRAEEVRSQLVGMLPHPRSSQQHPRQGPQSSCASNTALLRQALAVGYVAHVAERRSASTFVNLSTGALCELHPSSALRHGEGAASAQYVVYHELVLTGKEYMRTVTVVDPRWVAAAAPWAFTVADPHSSSAAGVGFAGLRRRAVNEAEARMQHEDETSRRLIEAQARLEVLSGRSTPQHASCPTSPAFGPGESPGLQMKCTAAPNATAPVAPSRLRRGGGGAPIGKKRKRL